MADKPMPAWHSIESINEADRNMQIAKAMSRNDMLKLGFLKVEQLDDEEIRVGRGREKNGTINKQAARSDPLPQDLYQAILREHQSRMNDRLRAEMDASLDVMVEIRDDKTAEPRDRFQAAQYIYERVAGKTPDKVAVQVAKAPWEEVFEGIAAMPSPANRPDIIDAETVEPIERQPFGYIQKPQEEQDQDERPTEATQPPAPLPEPSWGFAGNVSSMPGDSADGTVHTGASGATVAEPPERPPEPTAEDNNPTVPPTEYAPHGTMANPWIVHVAPSPQNPTNTSSTAPPPNYVPPQAQDQFSMERASQPLSMRLRNSRLAAEELAEQRAAARTMRKDAKKARTDAEAGKLRSAATKRRIIARTLGLDALENIDFKADINPSDDGGEELSWQI